MRAAIVVAVGALAIGALAVLSPTDARQPVIATAGTPGPKPAFDKIDRARARLDVRLELVAEGFERPTDIQPVPGQPGRLVVLEKTGAAWWLDLGSGETGKWLTRDVLTRSEQGLLGLAFHPAFARNGRFYLNFSVALDGRKHTRVAEFTVAAGQPLERTRPKQSRVLMDVEQPWANHNAGQLAFGPDGMLYIGMGDGGAANDPRGHGQNLETLLGAMLRVDVDAAARPYGIPPDNPFVGREGARPEIWAYGLRNPWRYSFTPDGRLVVADVGQNAFEEIALVARGENHGWKLREGGRCFPSGRRCTGGELTDPIWEYPHAEGTSVTGGLVYTGAAVPALKGLYVFGDFTTGRVWALRLPARPGLQPESALRALGRWPINISTFGVDHRGEMYVADFTRGRVYRFAADR